MLLRYELRDGTGSGEPDALVRHLREEMSWAEAVASVALLVAALLSLVLPILVWKLTREVAKKKWPE